MVVSKRTLLVPFIVIAMLTNASIANGQGAGIQPGNVEDEVIKLENELQITRVKLQSALGKSQEMNGVLKQLDATLVIVQGVTNELERYRVDCQGRRDRYLTNRSSRSLKASYRDCVSRFSKNLWRMNTYMSTVPELNRKMASLSQDIIDITTRIEDLGRDIALEEKMLDGMNWSR